MKDEPAFPAHTVSHEVQGLVLDVYHSGLTKREYFAAILWCRELPNRTITYKDRPAERARRAVEHADALIAELSKEGE